MPALQKSDPESGFDCNCLKTPLRRKKALNAGIIMDMRALLMGLSFVLMWSSAFTSARIAVAYASPLLLLSVP